MERRRQEKTVNSEDIDLVPALVNSPQYEREKRVHRELEQLIAWNGGGRRCPYEVVG